MTRETTIYLDHNATTPLHPAVLEAMSGCYRDAHANPASQHGPGRQARRTLETARERLASLLGAQVGGVHEDRVILTSGGTEANNLAIRGLTPTAGRIVVSAIEHPSVAEAANARQREGYDVRWLPVTRDGVVEMDALAACLDDRTRLVSVMLGNNETGVLQPVREVVEACAERGVAVHTDAVQAVGKIPVNFRELGVAAMTVAAHKFHGPAGVGALLVRHGVVLQPLFFGGFQQAGMRPGTEVVALAVGMCTALEMWQAAAAARQARMTALRDRFEQRLLQLLPRAIVIARNAPRLPHTSNIAFPGYDRQALQMALDLRGVACSTGSACASGSSEPSRVLLAMGLPREWVEGSLRFSLGAFTTGAEIDEAVERIAQAVRGSPLVRAFP